VESFLEPLAAVKGWQTPVCDRNGAELWVTEPQATRLTAQALTIAIFGE